ncbi:MBL fold metallo-hydrolase [Halorussus pelagicus]|uniref:MBL fold metallo-hydrolase n=1 Tax=Halorussus pelagicus TaxID=2505977 RepID=UPI000FFC5B24|nr:MBL fold metallo-hydrolase [Halorussus pelagicus]
MQVTLLGTGDTTGTPTPDCDCDTCREARNPGETTRRRLRERGIDASDGVERSRFSVHVRNERTDEALLIDASPDFRHQFLTHDVGLPDEVLITHIHFDHLDGLGNAYRLFDDLPVHAVGEQSSPARQTQSDDADERDPLTGESVADTIRSKYDYLDRVTVHDRAPLEPFEVCGLEVTLVPVEHPPMLCYGVVVEDPETGAKLSLTGDTNYDVPEQSRERLADADLLLADGIVPAHLCEHHPMGGDHHGPDGVPRTFGTKHMTREGALALADELDADETRLVHLAHYYPVEEAFEEPLAVDGEQYEL